MGTLSYDRYLTIQRQWEHELVLKTFIIIAICYMCDPSVLYISLVNNSTGPISY